MVIPIMGLALAAGTTCAGAASLPMVASAQAATPAATDSPPPPAPPSSRVRLRGQKWAAPRFQRSEAGVAWSVRPGVTLELNYERSALGPTMRHDHDDGILTRLKLGF